MLEERNGLLATTQDHAQADRRTFADFSVLTRPAPIWITSRLPTVLELMRASSLGFQSQAPVIS
jgi:hypothetical protein